MGAKTLLSAVELGVFSTLALGPADLPTLRQKLGLHQRAARDFLGGAEPIGAPRRVRPLRYRSSRLTSSRSRTAAGSTWSTPCQFCR